MAHQEVEWPPGPAAACRNCSNISVFLFISKSAQLLSGQCCPASKIEYNSAKKHPLRNRFDFYVSNGPIWRRQYWYCQ
jgi:hypothetical protein